MADKGSFQPTQFGVTYAVHRRCKTPNIQSSTYQLTDERYAGWAAGAQHTYADIKSGTRGGCREDLKVLEGAEDGELFASGMAAISTTLMGLLSQGDHSSEFRRIRRNIWLDDRGVKIYTSTTSRYKNFASYEVQFKRTQRCCILKQSQIQ